MKTLMTIFLTAITFAGFSQSFSSNYGGYTQTYTTESKTCGHCGAVVSNNSTVGMRCPHCGVIWGSEHTTRSTSYANDTRSIPSSGYATTNSSANLRTGPSTNYGIISTLPVSTSLTILDKTGNWVKVSFTDYSVYYGSEVKTGWVYASLLEF